MLVTHHVKEHLFMQLQSLLAATCIYKHHHIMILDFQGIKVVYVAELPSTQERISDGRRHNEFWGDYPDIWDEPWGRVHRPFDSRAAMAPFVAHQLLKKEGVEYKWMLYGDDDTMWFMSAVLDLLRDYDSELPYFISGAVSVQSMPGISYIMQQQAWECAVYNAHVSALLFLPS